MRSISSSRAPPPLLGSKHQRAVLHERPLIQQFSEVLPRRAPAPLVTFGDRLGACRVQPKLVALAHSTHVRALVLLGFGVGLGG